MTLGATIGSLFGGPFLAYGRWNSILIANLCIIIGSSLSLIYTIFPLICFGKFIYGLGAGAFNVFAPKMIAEIAPNEINGLAGTIF